MSNHTCKATAKKAPTAPISGPEALQPAPTCAGHQHTLTSKQQQLINEQSKKQAASHDKAYVAALRTHQARKEAYGFCQQKVIPDIEMIDDMGPESEDEEDNYQPDEGAFTSVTLAPVNKTTVWNGHTLTHRVDMDKENSVPFTPVTHVSGQVAGGPRKKLIRQVTGEAITPPVMMVAASAAPLSSSQFQFATPKALAAPISGVQSHQDGCHIGPFTPRVQASYGRGDGTFHHSHPLVPDAEFDDELNGDVGVYEEPIHYIYPDAHPDLENFPASEQVAAVDALHIWKEPPATMSEDTTIVAKKPKIEGSGTRGHVCTSDYDKLTKSLVEETMSIYHAQIGAVEPYPDHVEAHKVATEVWIETCRARGICVEFEEEILKLITERASQCHGQLKTIARVQTESAYKLENGDDKHDVHSKVEALLDCATFIYKASIIYLLDSQAHTGIYLHPVIQQIINKMWFKNKNDKGVIHPEFLENGMLSLITIALTITVIENCLDKWQTGEHVDVPFTAAVYKDKYGAHLKSLKEFNEKTKEVNIIPCLCKHMLKTAFKYVKVDNKPLAMQALKFTDVELDTAKKEWENLVFSDEDD